MRHKGTDGLIQTTSSIFPVKKQLLFHILLLFRLRYRVPCFQGQIKVTVTDVVVAPYPELLSVQFCTNAENFMLLSPSEQFLLFSQLSSCTISVG